MKRFGPVALCILMCGGAQPVQFQPTRAKHHMAAAACIIGARLSSSFLKHPEPEEEVANRACMAVFAMAAKELNEARSPQIFGCSAGVNLGFAMADRADDLKRHVPLVHQSMVACGLALVTVAQNVE